MGGGCLTYHLAQKHDVLPADEVDAALDVAVFLPHVDTLDGVLQDQVGWTAPSRISRISRTSRPATPPWQRRVRRDRCAYLLAHVQKTVCPRAGEWLLKGARTSSDANKRVAARYSTGQQISTSQLGKLSSERTRPPTKLIDGAQVSN